GEMNRGSKFSSLIFWSWNFNKVNKVKFKWAFQIIVQCSYVHYKFVKQPAYEICFHFPDFRSNLGEVKYLEFRHNFFCQIYLFNWNFRLQFSNEHRWFQFFTVFFELAI